MPKFQPDPDDEEVPDDIGIDNVENDKKGDMDDEDELIKLLAGEINMDKSNDEDVEVGEGPIDTDEKFITKDLVELPPKWFYEKVKVRNLPRGLRLTNKMIDILDKVYFDGLSRAELVSDLKYASSTVNMTFRRIRELWKMNQAGTLNLSEPEPVGNNANVPGAAGSASGRRSSEPGVRTLAMTGKTTTFREIDAAISQFLKPQIERSTQFQEVMARIGMLATYTLMQLGIVDSSKFVVLAEAITNDPNNLYTYVARNLEALINVADKEKLKEFTKELLLLKETNKRLYLRITDLEATLAKYEEWIEDGKIIISKAMDFMSPRDRVEFGRWYARYVSLKGGGRLAKAEASTE